MSDSMKGSICEKEKVLRMKSTRVELWVIACGDWCMEMGYWLSAVRGSGCKFRDRSFEERACFYWDLSSL